MPMVYDNWERLVVATLDREKLRQLALAPSMETNFNSSISSSSFNSAFDFRSDFSSASFHSAYDFQSDSFTDYVPGSVTDRVVEAAEKARRFKEECAEIKSKAENLAGLLRQVKRTTTTSNDFYERPGLFIIPEAELALEKALKLLLKCRRQGVRRVFNIILAGAFRKMSSQLENSIGDVSWLLRVSDDRADEYLGLPPLASNGPIFCLVWEQIAILYTDSLEDRADAASSLASLARDNDTYAKLIIEEDGVRPLLKLVEEGRPEGQENAAKAIGFLGNEPENAEDILDAGACHVFVEILKRGPTKVQAMVAWAVSELATHYPKCQQIFAEHDIIPLLVSHLASETTNLSLSGEMEDPATKENIKIMAAKALWQLAKGNSPICRSITDTRALLSFAALLEKGPEEAQYNSAMALLEITQVEELKISAFNQISPACKAVDDQLLRIVENEESEQLLIPCIKIIGNLATTFRATHTRIIIPLVKLLDGRETEVSMEACITLTKFACSEDSALCLNQSRAIVDAGGAKHLVHLLYFGDEKLQICALILLCHIIKHVPENELLAKVELLIVLEWAWNQSSFRQCKDVEKLLPEAKGRLVLLIPQRIKRTPLN